MNTCCLFRWPASCASIGHERDTAENSGVSSRLTDHRELSRHRPKDEGADSTAQTCSDLVIHREFY
jgi:hypothetical protein